MPLGNPKSGFGHAGEFQSSALPYVTSSQAPLASGGALEIAFPNVTRVITVTNREAPGTYLRVGFTRNGVQTSGNYYLLNGGDTIVAELRIKSLFLAGHTTLAACSVLAGLTTVDARDMPLLSGSEGWQGVG